MLWALPSAAVQPSVTAGSTDASCASAAMGSASCAASSIRQVTNAASRFVLSKICFAIYDILLLFKRHAFMSPSLLYGVSFLLSRKPGCQFMSLRVGFYK